MKSIYYLLPLLLVGFALTASAQTDRDHIRHGNRLLRDSMFTDAQVKYQKAIEVDNTNAIAHYNLGYTLMMQGKAEDAMKEYEQAARLEKNKHRLSQIYHNMGVISLASQKYDQAVACYRQALVRWGCGVSSGSGAGRSTRPRTGRRCGSGPCPRHA